MTQVQLKPTKVNPVTEEVEELQLIVKWGGVLTHLGREQAESLGFLYRQIMYPSSHDDGGLLRLHATYRHDFKCHSSDEGRVQTTAAAFIKALLDLEGSSLVRCSRCRIKVSKKTFYLILKTEALVADDRGRVHQGVARPRRLLVGALQPVIFSIFFFKIEENLLFFAYFDSY